MIRAAWLGALLLLLVQPAEALQPQPSLDHYGNQVWRTDSGLPQNTVHSILQTRDGYLWLATEGGLVRFDGIDFVTFDAAHTPQFESDLVYDLFEDHANTLWISTAAGLVSYAGGQFARYTPAQGLPAATVWFTYEDRLDHLWAITPAGPAFFTANRFIPVAGAGDAGPLTRRGLAEDPRGTLWLGGSDGVFALDLRSATPKVALHLLQGADVEAVALDSQQRVQQRVQQRIWIGSSQGLALYADGALTQMVVPHAAPRTEVTSLLADGGEGMWVGGPAGIAHLAPQGTWSVPSFSTPLGRVDQLLRDRQGVLWVAAERGVFRLAAGPPQSFIPVPALAGNRVLSMLEDHEGDLWLGTDGNGLHLLRDQKFTTYTTHNALSGNLVRCVYQGSDGELWIGTDGAGLNRRTRNGFAHLTTADGLSSNVILALAESGGDLYVGTPNGLNLLHPGPGQRVQHFTTANDLPDDFIRSLYTDPDGSLWIGTRHGLAHLAHGKFTSFSSQDGLAGDFIGVILRTHDGDLWIGTSNGLSRYHDGVFSNYTVRQGLSDNVVTALFEDKQGTLWLGTNGGGLNRMRQGKMERVQDSAARLPGTIYSILEDARGRLWLSAKTGIFRVSLAATRVQAVTAYGIADGMNIRECSGGGHPAAWKLADGSLWFATLDGVSAIDPVSAPENRVPPPVVLEKVLVDDQARNPDQAQGLEGLTIAPGTHRLEIQYAALSFVAPLKVQYRYRLQGFDPGWIEAGSRRAAFYTNLPPGRYRFQVLAANNDGVWNTTGASFGLRLLPHYYQTWWFSSALALAALLLAYLIYRWRVLQVESQFAAVLAERGRLAREIHDTLAQGFVGVSVQLELVARLLAGSREAAMERLDQAMEHLDQARALVRASLTEARTSIWNLRSQAPAAEDLPSRLRQSCTRISGGSTSKVYLQVKGTYRPLGRKMEEELLRIGQEAVANAVRHAGATRIEVELTYAAARVGLRVEDDGRGFHPAASAPEGHYGIRGMRERAGEIDAALVLESTPGGGTRVLLDAPVDARVDARAKGEA